MSKKRKSKFRPREAFLFKTKAAAKRKAERLRCSGVRAIVQPSSKTTRKRSPSLRWVVFRGQKKKGC